jgi:hypothetical protein
MHHILVPNGTDRFGVIIGVIGHTPEPEFTIYDYLRSFTSDYEGQANTSFINSTIINLPQVYQPYIKIMEYVLDGYPIFE